MKVEFADSFWKSLKTLSKHQTWWYKTYEVFRHKIPMFFENVWYFRKVLWRFRSWDYTFNLMLLRRSLEKTANTIEFYGHEIDAPRIKKVDKIKRAIELIKNIEENDYIYRAEQVLGEIKNTGWPFEDKEDTPEEEQHNKKVFDLSNEWEQDEWNELFNILRGQNHQEYVTLIENSSEEEKEQRDLWYEWFDGSGMRHWWD